MGAHGYERHVRRRAVGFAAFAAMSCLAWGLPMSAQASPPVVATDGASGTGATTATVSGNADPEGQSTTLHADYDLVSEPWCTSHGKEGKPAETTPEPLGSSFAMFSEISVGLEGLTPGSEYCTELVAHNESGTTYGGQRRFTTTSALAPPSIESESASNITPTDATLEAQINPEDFERGAHYQFQVVTDTSDYLSEFACPPERVSSLCLGLGTHIGALPIGLIPAGLQDQSVSLDLASADITLHPSTTYHYRILVARAVPTEDTIEWEAPILYGPDETFTTPDDVGYPLNTATSPGPQPITGPAQNIGQSTTTPAVIDPAGEVMPSPKMAVLTNAQKLAKTVRACKRKPKKQPARCEKQTRNKYGMATKQPHRKGKRKK